MRIEFLKDERIEEFAEYCRVHRAEVDESFLYEEDLKGFTPSEENPTYVLINEEGKIVGAASLIIDEYSRRGRKARFRIFHSEIEEIEYYNMLLQSVLSHTEGLDKIFVFVPTVNEKLTEFIKGLNFVIERYSFFLVRENLEVPEQGLPEGYEIRSFKKGMNEAVWCEIRNTAFAKLKGSETPITPEMVSRMLTNDDYLEGGLMILYHGEKPVGIVRGADDEFEGSPCMNIGPIAIIPEYQGKGLGRSLLRASLKFALDRGYHKTSLCVNAENERAKALYIQEGFSQVEAVGCYNYEL